MAVFKHSVINTERELRAKMHPKGEVPVYSTREHLIALIRFSSDSTPSPALAIPRTALDSPELVKQ